MSNLYRFSHSLLSYLPVELTYRVGILGLSLPLWRFIRPAYDSRLCINLGDLKLTSPVIAAGGLDKNCSYPQNLLGLGFGGVVAGTVTLRPRTGNPPPRFVRQHADSALINAMGFPNKGIDYVTRKLSRRRNLDYTILSISGDTVADIVATYQKTLPLRLPIEINISSPNTKSLADFQQPAQLAALLDAVIAAEPSRTSPLFVKLPRQDAKSVSALAKVAADKAVSGIVVCNSKPVTHSALSTGAGGLSGRPIYQSTLDLIAAVRSEVGPKMPLVACGGVSEAKHVWELLKNGATATQLYTALVYEGPRLISNINRQLIQAMDAHQINSITAVTTQNLDWPLR